MRACFSTLGCPGWPWERILAEAQALGCAAIELRGVGAELDHTRLPQFAPGRLPAARAALARHGLAVACLDTSVVLTRGGGANLDEARRNVDLAAGLGAPYVRVFADVIEGEAALATAAAALDELAIIAAPYAVRPLIEVHGNFNTVELCRAFFARLTQPNAGVLWDIGHSHKTYGLDFQPFLACIAPHLHHVHIKDEGRPDGGRWRPVDPGQGEVPMAAAIRALRGLGYAGCLSIEHELRWQRDLAPPEQAFPRYLALMRAAWEA